ncbi:related to UPF3 - Nonsense-mediated mRNA decay protein [Melanopsichium pennsylvanicum]|uniref:U6 snRNA phosphodiesterase 1 n=1 Tax=Melanopsichium pennsylvanicum TaxID=63383 RepID=A0AAJ4XUM6_9BASI|nr:related to UPF3 - Nonsense-mediated mRNA decay protein [Melanopsichium pennsylvanicum]
MSDALAGLSQYTDSETDDVISSDTDKEHAVPMQVGQHDHNRDRSPATQLPVSGRANWLKRKLPPLELDRPPQDDDDVDPAAAKSATSGGSAKKLTRGEWLCYCFVEVHVEPSLNKLITECHNYLQRHLGSDHNLLDLRVFSDLNNSEGTLLAKGEALATRSIKGQLHISLTRPFTVHSYEREEYVKVASAEVSRLRDTIGRIAHLANDDQSRRFMVLEVGSGREMFQKLSISLSTELRRAFKAKQYYEEARFHASTACFLDTPTTSHIQNATDATAKTLTPSFCNLVSKVEAKRGDLLRKSPPIWATRVGIQVANCVSYVEL